MMKYTISDYLIRYHDRFTEREIIVSAFMYYDERPEFSSEADAKSTILANEVPGKPGGVFIVKGGGKRHYAYLKKRTISVAEIGYISELTKDNNAPIDIVDKVILPPRSLPNVYTNTVTTAGRFLLNVNVLIKPFGGIIPFINEPFNLNKLERQIIKLYLDKEITVEQVHTYVKYAFFIGHFSELCDPAYSEKSLTTDPKIIKRRDELIAKYRDKLDDPIIQAKIEDELIKMDKEYIKGDVSNRFYKPFGKSYHTHRKKMFLTNGAVSDYSENASTTKFLTKSLSEGFDAESMPVAVNDARAGAHSRGVGTAKGGDLTKYIIRVFLDVIFTKNDCGVKKGLKIKLDANNIKKYIGRHLVNGQVITEDNFKKYTGKVVELRSPLWCKDVQGICPVCLGDTVSAYDHTNVLGMAILITSLFMDLEMASMHGTKLTTYNITNISTYTL